MHMFGIELRRIAPQLRSHGLSINFEQRRGERIIILKAEGADTRRPSTDTPQSWGRCGCNVGSDYSVDLL